MNCLQNFWEIWEGIWIIHFEAYGGVYLVNFQIGKVVKHVDNFLSVTFFMSIQIFPFKSTTTSFFNSGLTKLTACICWQIIKIPLTLWLLCIFFYKISCKIKVKIGIFVLNYILFVFILIFFKTKFCKYLSLHSI